MGMLKAPMMNTWRTTDATSILYQVLFSHLSSGGLVTILTFSTPASRMMPMQFTTKP